MTTKLELWWFMWRDRVVLIAVLLLFAAGTAGLVLLINERIEERRQVDEWCDSQCGPYKIQHCDGNLVICGNDKVIHRDPNQGPENNRGD